MKFTEPAQLMLPGVENWSGLMPSVVRIFFLPDSDFRLSTSSVSVAHSLNSKEVA
jgi:hypothetical protein